MRAEFDWLGSAWVWLWLGGRFHSALVAAPAGAGGAAAHDDGGVQEVPQDGTRAVHGAAQRAPGAARG